MASAVYHHSGQHFICLILLIWNNIYVEPLGWFNVTCCFQHSILDNSYCRYCWVGILLWTDFFLEKYKRKVHVYCFSALHIASMYGQAKLIDILIQHGSLPDSTDYLGCTPLHLAAQKGFQNIIVSIFHIYYLKFFYTWLLGIIVIVLFFLVFVHHKRFFFISSDYLQNAVNNYCVA